MYDAFEHWKKLLNLLCTCDEALPTYGEMFDALIGWFKYSVRFLPVQFINKIMGNNDLPNNGLLTVNFCVSIF